MATPKLLRHLKMFIFKSLNTSNFPFGALRGTQIFFHTFLNICLFSLCLCTGKIHPLLFFLFSLLMVCSNFWDARESD